MIRTRSWPSAPKHPHLAFTFELLDWAEALLLECRVALKHFCRALYLKCPHVMNKVSSKERSHLIFSLLYTLRVLRGRIDC